MDGFLKKDMKIESIIDLEMSVKISIQYGHIKICKPIDFYCLQDIRMNQFKKDSVKMSAKCLPNIYQKY